ncbi:hypothetical protein N7493_000327 [Penicillium malachiteum]|uniref:Uncharacterized protein n=1 Tax=Penicillium malachiteum TaxID=1324776 RepID=A0AAD6N1B3_9EURO|nr:hypothetical protein N7493_000327 [Penicillium malachiteum]
MGKSIALNNRYGAEQTQIEQAVRDLEAQFDNSIKQVCDIRCGAHNVNVQVDKIQQAQDWWV